MSVRPDASPDDDAAAAPVVPRSIGSFLASQWPVLLCAVALTVFTAVLAAEFLGGGFSSWFVADQDLLRKNSRGQPDPGGGTAVALLVPPLLAATCWWSFLSEWRDFRKQSRAASDGGKPPE